MTKLAPDPPPILTISILIFFKASLSLTWIWCKQTDKLNNLLSPKESETSIWSLKLNSSSQYNNITSVCILCDVLCVYLPKAGHGNHITGSSHGTSGVRAKTGTMNYNIISVSGGGRLGTLQNMPWPEPRI